MSTKIKCRCKCHKYLQVEFCNLCYADHPQMEGKDRDIIDNVIGQLEIYKKGAKIKNMTFHNRPRGMDLHIDLET